jgi:hypothetical protein
MGALHLVPRLGKDLGEDIAEVVVVIDDENMALPTVLVHRALPEERDAGSPRSE